MTPEHAGGDLSALRERVARITDPDTWKLLDYYRKHYPDSRAAQGGSVSVTGSLAKADTIIALLEQQP